VPFYVVLYAQAGLTLLLLSFPSSFKRLLLSPCAPIMKIVHSCDESTPTNIRAHTAYDARLVDIWACGIVYYCLHFQELPWRAAQPASDPLYTAYATACASPNATVSACPPTINNLNPRACRSLMRRMLEPDPRQRATIEEVVGHAWIQTIEVCHEVDTPKHVHVSARAMGMTYSGVGGANGNGV
jgi:serine/threonine protein kinase